MKKVLFSTLALIMLAGCGTLQPTGLLDITAQSAEADGNTKRKYPKGDFLAIISDEVKPKARDLVAKNHPHDTVIHFTTSTRFSDKEDIFDVQIHAVIGQHEGATFDNGTHVAFQAFYDRETRELTRVKPVTCENSRFYREYPWFGKH